MRLKKLFAIALVVVLSQVFTYAYIVYNTYRQIVSPLECHYVPLRNIDDYDGSKHIGRVLLPVTSHLPFLAFHDMYIYYKKQTYVDKFTGKDEEYFECACYYYDYKKGEMKPYCKSITCLRIVPDHKYTCWCM